VKKAESSAELLKALSGSRCDQKESVVESVHSVTCPECKALPGMPCRPPFGDTISVHVARLVALERAKLIAAHKVPQIIDPDCAFCRPGEKV
jgi:hypothetical protein